MASKENSLPESANEKATDNRKRQSGRTANVSGPFSLKEIASILEMLEKHDVTEFRLDRGEEKISLRRGKPQPRVQKSVGLSAAQALQQMVASYPQVVPQAMPSNIVPFVSPEHTARAESALRESTPSVASSAQAEGSVVPKKALKEITSPMVGTFYRRPAVDAEPYVAVGDSVKKGDVLCIVEAMKLMNEIESDTAGKIVEICLEDGQMVEYGEVLFRVEAL